MRSTLTQLKENFMVRKEMFLAAAIIVLWLAAGIWLACKGYLRRCLKTASQRTVLATSATTAMLTSQGSDWANSNTALKAIPVSQGLVVIPSRASTGSATAVFPGSGHAKQSQGKAGDWAISRSPMWPPITRHSLSPVNKNRLRDRSREASSRQSTPEVRTNDTG